MLATPISDLLWEIYVPRVFFKLLNIFLLLSYKDFLFFGVPLQWGMGQHWTWAAVRTL